MQQALQMVRYELGPDAKVLQTRELPTGWWERLSRGRQFEVRARRPAGLASSPLPLAARGRRAADLLSWAAEEPAEAQPAAAGRGRPRIPLPTDAASARGWPGARAAAGGAGLSPIPMVPRPESGGPLFELLAQLLDAEISEPVARELLELVRAQATVHELRSLADLQQRLRARAAVANWPRPVRLTCRPASDA